MLKLFADFPEAERYDADEGAEVLHHDTPDEAVEYHLDGVDPILDADLLTTPLRIYAFKRAKVSASDVENLPGIVLNDLMQWLDDNEYGDPEDGSEPTPKMELAARVFIDTIVREFKVWSCECIGYTEVDVAEWIAKNRPDWLVKTEAEMTSDGNEVPMGEPLHGPWTFTRTEFLVVKDGECGLPVVMFRADGGAEPFREWSNARSIAPEIARLAAENNALELTVSEGHEIEGELLGALAMLSEEELKPCVNGCHGSPRRESVAMVHEARDAWTKLEAENERLRELLDEAGCAICSLTCGYPKEVDDTLPKRIQEALTDHLEGGE
jgi:hypothetical protein